MEKRVFADLARQIEAGKTNPEPLWGLVADIQPDEEGRQVLYNAGIGERPAVDGPETGHQGHNSITCWRGPLAPETTTSHSTGSASLRRRCAETFWKAETTSTPRGTREATICAADPCQMPTVRTAPSPIAVASGTAMETTIWPSLNESRMDLTVEAVCSKGTDRMTIGTSRAASSFPKPAHVRSRHCRANLLRRLFCALAAPRSNNHAPDPPL